MHKYSCICIKTNMQLYALNMQIYALDTDICNQKIMQKYEYKNMPKYAKICQNIQKICNDPTSMDLKRIYSKNTQKYAKYAGMKFICKICRNLYSPLCWWSPSLSLTSPESKSRNKLNSLARNWESLPDSASGTEVRSHMSRVLRYAMQSLISIGRCALKPKYSLKEFWDLIQCQKGDIWKSSSPNWDISKSYLDLPIEFRNAEFA